MPLPRSLGNEINIEGEKWIAVKPCVLVGRTIKNNTPVIMGEDGPELHQGHFVRARHFKTLPKEGQTYTEVMVLRGYEKIRPEELARKEIEYAHYLHDTFLAICTDKTYIKLVAESDEYEGDTYLINDDLTLYDLKLVGAITEQVYAEHEEAQRADYSARQKLANEHTFRLAIQKVGGVDRAKELLKEVRG
jgi:hypothetical protein